eukprot:Nk52_evm1s1304 gene=Nk52_evmTU1s1304
MTTNTATIRNIENAEDRMALEEIVETMIGETGRTPQPNTTRRVEEEPLEQEPDEEGYEEIDRCFRAQGSNAMLQCWECNGTGHGVLQCPQLKSWTREKRVERLRELRKMGRGRGRRSKWESSSTKTKREQARAVGADAICQQCHLSTHLDSLGMGNR